MNMIIGIVLVYANCMQQVEIKKGHISVTLSLSVLFRLDLNQ
jgi:hypothetical protein